MYSVNPFISSCFVTACKEIVEDRDPMTRIFWKCGNMEEGFWKKIAEGLSMIKSVSSLPETFSNQNLLVGQMYQLLSEGESKIPRTSLSNSIQRAQNAWDDVYNMSFLETLFDRGQTKANALNEEKSIETSFLYLFTRSYLQMLKAVCLRHLNSREAQLKVMDESLYFFVDFIYVMKKKNPNLRISGSLQDPRHNDFANTALEIIISSASPVVEYFTLYTEPEELKSCPNYKYIVETFSWDSIRSCRDAILN